MQIVLLSQPYEYICGVTEVALQGVYYPTLHDGDRASPLQAATSVPVTASLS